MGASQVMGEVFREARREGWSVEKTKGGHVRLRHPDVEGFIIAPKTTRSHDAPRNALALMRRALRDGRVRKVEHGRRG